MTSTCGEGDVKLFVDDADERNVLFTDCSNTWDAMNSGRYLKGTLQEVPR